MEVDDATWLSISNLSKCLKYCPTPGGAEGCRSGRNGVDPTRNVRGGSFDDRLACQIFLTKSPGDLTAVGSAEGRDWAESRCPNEHGYAASLVFAKAQQDPGYFKPAVTIMNKGAVKGAGFAPMLFEALKSPDAEVRALALRLLKDNFINPRDAKDRVQVPVTVLVPLMYDSDKKVAGQAVTAVLQHLMTNVASGDARVRAALPLFGPVTGTNDVLNPLPAGIFAPPPVANRTAALLALRQTVVGSPPDARLSVLRHLMRLNCEQDTSLHKIAFSFYYEILTPQADALRSPVPGIKPEITREDQIADIFRKDLFAAKAPSGCVGPIRPL